MSSEEIIKEMVINHNRYKACNMANIEIVEVNCKDYYSVEIKSDNYNGWICKELKAFRNLSDEEIKERCFNTLLVTVCEGKLKIE